MELSKSEIQDVVVKNSSTDINFGRYHSQIIIRVPRIYFDKKYITRFECDEERNILRMIIEEEK